MRRDLFDLASTGALHKVQGGAKRIRGQTEGSFEERRGQHSAAKAAMARTLAGMIEPGETLFMDTGTTTLACAEELAADRRADGHHQFGLDRPAPDRTGHGPPGLPAGRRFAYRQLRKPPVPWRSSRSDAFGPIMPW